MPNKFHRKTLKTNEKKNNRTRNRTSLKRNFYVTANDKQTAQVVVFLLQFLNNVKMFHWNTYFYSEHKATDMLYEKLNDLVDELVETLMGKSGHRILNVNRMEIRFDKSKTQFKHNLVECREKLLQWEPFMKKNNLVNLRDEIVDVINKTLYLLSMI